MDVYEGESAYFFSDSSAKIIQDDNIARLMTFYNVFIRWVAFVHIERIVLDTESGSGHQAFLTEEALRNIADTTIKNLKDLESTGTCANLVV